jgi:hypothetical protein
MIKLLKKYWAVIIFVLSFIFDAQYQILEQFIANTFWLNIVKGLGGVLLAYLTEKGATSIFAKEGDTDIGGGGIKNPKP